MESCPLCESRDFTVLYPSTLPARSDHRSQFECTSTGLGIHPDIYRCRTCTLVFNEPGDGSQDHLEAYGAVEDPDYLEQKPARHLTFERELRFVEGLTSGRDLLDIGCYTGFFLELARARGWNVAGVEPSRWAAAHAQRELAVEVFNGPVETFRPSRRFDVVTMWDVVEHLTNPLAVLRHVRTFLKPEGYLVFATHNLDRPLPRHMRRYYPLYMEMHTIHLNERTRDLLIEKSGLATVSVHPHRRALRFGYFLSKMLGAENAAGRFAAAATRAVGIDDYMIWIGFSGVETIATRPLTDSPLGSQLPAGDGST